VARRANPGIDHERNVGQPLAQKFQRVRIDDALGAADRRRPWHYHPAAGIHQPHRDRQIFRAIGKHLEAILDQELRGFDEAEHIRLQRIVVSDDFQFDPGCRKQFTREFCGGHRLAHAAATGGVRQHGDAEFADQRPKGVAGFSSGSLPPQRYGHDLGGGTADRRLHDRRRGIERRADQQARFKFAVIEFQHGVASLHSSSRRTPGPIPRDLACRQMANRPAR
jgi:hypothetical protein